MTRCDDQTASLGDRTSIATRSANMQVAEARLPTASDWEFRQALKDGVLLCSLLNIVRPGSVRKVPSELGPAHIVHSVCPCSKDWRCCAGLQLQCCPVC